MYMKELFDSKKVSEKKVITRIDVENKVVNKYKDNVVVETSIPLYVNSEFYALFTCSPTKIREMIIGNLLSQKIISKLDEIHYLKKHEGKIIVKLKQNSKSSPRAFIYKRLKKEFYPLKLTPETILNSANELGKKASVFRKTGGTHVACLYSAEGNLLLFSEDIGRYNAIDKVIGEATLKGIDLRKTFLTISGRVTIGIIAKAANMKIPVVISVSAPTDKAVEAAEKIGLTLVGFARNKRFNVYSHLERIQSV
ncbi:MAG: formate dehydrogenase accessory sulfurtransferase FdhD [Candidatus Bathyarchaeia archaeon]